MEATTETGTYEYGSISGQHAGCVGCTPERAARMVPERLRPDVAEAEALEPGQTLVLPEGRWLRRVA